MFRVLIIAKEKDQTEELSSGLTQKGFGCSVGSKGEEAFKQVAEQAPDIVLIEIDGHSDDPRQELLQRVKHDRHLPIIALISKESLDSLDSNLDIDDFVLMPCDVTELTSRIKKLLQKTADRNDKELIKYGDLTIDLAKCEVSVAHKPIMLTFKEYELLKFLVGNKGRVFTREALLNRVWGYDYYGGDRTVDVHIRRLRSKIEDQNHTFIETVRNIGYKFASEK